MDRIYLDHSATTPLDETVFKKMSPYFCEIYGNANSQHAFGQKAAAAVDEARDTIARLIGAKPNEIYFTSGGTEADNWAIRGTARAMSAKGKHLIISCIEHPAMMTTAKELVKEGFEVSYAPVDADGTVIVSELEKLIRKDTVFIGVMYANNEIGTVQPIDEISKIAKAHGIPFFTDAVQAAGSLPLSVAGGSITMMSFSGHKFYGPKGVGVLYVKSGFKLGKLITGGHQERTMRGGTTNVPGVVGIAEAFKIANEQLEANVKYISELRDRFISRVESEILYVKLNGHRTNRLCSNADFTFKYVEGEAILFRLDLAGIAVSSGSACSSGSLEPSHVLLSIGLPVGEAHGSIRFSFGKHNTVEQVDYTVDKLKEVIKSLRGLSPIFPKNLPLE